MGRERQTERLASQTTHLKWKRLRNKKMSLDVFTVLKMWICGLVGRNVSP